MKLFNATGLAIAALMLTTAGVALAEPAVVSGPATDPECHVPWADDTQFFQFEAKTGPFRVALANGYIANTWRIHMIQTAKAYAAQPDVAAKLKEFKVVSTGEDVAAQIAAINNFIDSGYDAIVVNAQNPTAFAPVIKRAKDAGVILVAFDNILDTKDAINVNVDQEGLGELWGNWLLKHIPEGGKILEVRGVAGTSVDTDRHNGIHTVLTGSGKPFEIVEVVGKWDDGTAQKATADAIAVHQKFDGITVQGGSTGTVQAVRPASSTIPLSPVFLSRTMRSTAMMWLRWTRAKRFGSRRCSMSATRATRSGACGSVPSAGSKRASKRSTSSRVISVCAASACWMVDSPNGEPPWRMYLA